MDMNSIIARLQNGESADTIANEMATMLNQAKAQVDQEASRKAKFQEAKEEICREIGALMMEYIDLVAPDLAEYADSNEIDLGQIVMEALDGTVVALQKTVELFQKLEDCGQSVKSHIDSRACPRKHETANTITPEQASNEIANFLKSLNLM